MSLKTDNTADQTSGTTEQAAEETKTLIYIGPSFRGVPHGAVYTNGPTKAYLDKKGTFPALADLLVTVESVVEKEKELKNEKSALSVIYKMAAELLKEE